MGQYLPKFKPGQTITYTVGGTGQTVTGGQLVEITGNRTVNTSAAESVKTVGVAGFDAKSGEKVTVHNGGVQKLVASAAITAGARVEAAATGRVAAGTTAPVGTALTAAAAAGAVVEVLMDR